MASSATAVRPSLCREPLPANFGNCLISARDSANSDRVWSSDSERALIFASTVFSSARLEWAGNDWANAGPHSNYQDTSHTTEVPSEMFLMIAFSGPASQNCRADTGSLFGARVSRAVWHFLLSPACPATSGANAYRTHEETP